MSKEQKVGNAVIRAVVGDITDMELEAFVYDITADAKLGTGYGGAIATRGGKAIQDELDAIGGCPTGQAIITSAGKLPVKHIIHLNGPKFHEPDQEAKLRSAVRSALKLADENGIAQLALPPVGTGFYQVDLGMCARVMVDTVNSHLTGQTNLTEVLFVALDTREHTPFAALLEQGG